MAYIFMLGIYWTYEKVIGDKKGHLSAAALENETSLFRNSQSLDQFLTLLYKLNNINTVWIVAQVQYNRIRKWSMSM